MRCSFEDGIGPVKVRWRNEGTVAGYIAVDERHVAGVPQLSLSIPGREAALLTASSDSWICSLGSRREVRQFVATRVHWKLKNTDRGVLVLPRKGSKQFQL
jgi:hypothetical protein